MDHNSVEKITSITSKTIDHALSYLCFLDFLKRACGALWHMFDYLALVYDVAELWTRSDYLRIAILMQRRIYLSQIPLLSVVKQLDYAPVS